MPCLAEGAKRAMDADGNSGTQGVEEENQNQRFQVVASEKKDDDDEFKKKILPQVIPLLLILFCQGTQVRHIASFLWMVTHATHGTSDPNTSSHPYTPRHHSRAQVNMLYPILVYMVDFYGVAGDDTRSLGKYCGILAAMFPLSMFVSAFFWGWVSDKIGRKPVLLLGVFSVGVGSILLGFTTSYRVALAIRIVTGLLCGVTPAIK